MRSERARYFVGVALALFVTGASMSSTRRVAASPVHSSHPVQEPPSPAVRSVRDGVFTSAQAGRGKKTFQAACASCHEIAFQSGPRFVGAWRDKTVGGLFDELMATMPPEAPGSLKPEEYSSVIAYLLQETGYPEGQHELPATSAELKSLRIEPPAK